MLSGGIARFVDATGPYDALFIGSNVPVVSDPKYWPDALAYAKRYTALAPDADLAMDYLHDLFSALAGLPVPIRVASLVTFDYYGTVDAQTARLRELGLHIYAPDISFAQRLDDLPDWLPGEKHFQRKREQLTSAWFDFVSESPVRILSGLHYVAEDEFFFRALDQRAILASVPGAEYLLRGQAKSSLRKRGIKPASKFLFNAYRVMNKLQMPVYSKFLSLRIFNVSYQGNLLDTRFVYTARGGFGIPVRKFLEIPAAGAMMICTPPVGYSAMGFVDGEHYVNASPEEAPDVILDMSKNLDRAQAMADKAQQVAWEVHSLRARAAQLRQCLDSIQEGTYRGSRWVAGKFVVEKVLSCAD